MCFCYALLKMKACFLRFVNSSSQIAAIVPNSISSNIWRFKAGKKRMKRVLSLSEKRIFLKCASTDFLMFSKTTRPPVRAK